MEKICIEIPAPLFFEIYSRFGSKTGEMITKSLSTLADQPAVEFRETSVRPKPHTITGRIWEIADGLKAQNGFTNRNDVVKACMSEGINMNTANTQFSHWLKEN